MMHPIRIRVTADFKKFAVWMSLAGLLWGVPTAVMAFSAQITAVDPHRGYAGGEHYVFFTASDDQGAPLKNVSIDDVALRINGEPYPINWLSPRKKTLDSETTFLVDPSILTSPLQHAFTTGMLDMLKRRQKNDSILLNVYGSRQSKPLPIVDIDTMHRMFKDVTTDSGTGMDFSEFIIQQSDQLSGSALRKRLVVVLSEKTAIRGISPDLQNHLRQLLKNRDMTPIFLVDGTEAGSFRAFNSHAQGQLYTFSTPATLISTLQDLTTQIQTEYVFSYRLLFLGTKAHQIQIKIQSDQGSEILQYDVSPRELWTESGQGLMISGVCMLFVVLGGTIGFLWLRKPRVHAYQHPGFQILTPGEDHQFIELENKNYTLDFLVDVPTKGNLRLSVNLNKVALVPQQETFLLEDKNYKNALLINRRRTHRTLLQNGDILDIGELTLLYCNQEPPVVKEADEETVLEANNPSPVSFIKPRGPIRKNMPILVSDEQKQEYVLIRNVTYVGASDMNDFVLKGEDIALKHMKIMRVGGQYKVQNLSGQEGTFVNNHRIEQRFLREGDDISIGNYKFKFRLGKN